MENFKEIKKIYKYAVIKVSNRFNDNKVEYVEYCDTQFGINEYGFVDDIAYAKPYKITSVEYAFKRLIESEQFKSYSNPCAEIILLSVGAKKMNCWASAMSQNYAQALDAFEWWKYVCK